MTPPHAEDLCWLADLAMLLTRHCYLGIGADVDAMDIDELRAVHRFLTRLQGAAEACYD